jgi:hypothetical protein
MSSIIRFFLTLCMAMAVMCSLDMPNKLDANECVADQAIVDTKAMNATSNGWTMYKQCDSQWSDQKLGTCSQTICSAGCAMSSVAMILQTKGAGQNPSTLNSWLKSNGGYSGGCNIVWSSVNAFGKVTYIGKEPGASETDICNGLKAGHGLVANVRNGAHWVLLTGCKGSGVFEVNDPAYSTTTYKKSDIVDLAVYH